MSKVILISFTDDLKMILMILISMNGKKMLTKSRKTRKISSFWKTLTIKISFPESKNSWFSLFILETFNKLRNEMERKKHLRN